MRRHGNIVICTSCPQHSEKGRTNAAWYATAWPLSFARYRTYGGEIGTASQMGAVIIARLAPGCRQIFNVSRALARQQRRRRPSAHAVVRLALCVPKNEHPSKSDFDFFLSTCWRFQIQKHPISWLLWKIYIYFFKYLLNDLLNIMRHFKYRTIMKCSSRALKR